MRSRSASPSSGAQSGRTRRLASGLWRRSRPLRGALDRARGLFPVTAVGLALGLLGWWVYARYVAEQADFVLRAAVYLGAALLGSALLFVVLGALVLALRLPGRRAPLVEVVGDAGLPTETGFSFPRLAGWPFVLVEVAWIGAPAATLRVRRDGGRGVESVVPAERGRADTIRRRFTVRDLFGLAALSFERSWPARVRVAPAQGRLGLEVTLRETAGEGYAHPDGAAVGDMVEMRRYGPGDPLRFILWKTYARTRRLLVRTPEKALAPEPSTVAILVAGPADEASASAARVLVEGGALGTDFLFFADGTEQAARAPEEAVDAIIDSARHREQGGRVLAQVLATVPLASLGRCVLFVPAADGPWREHVARFVAALPAPPSVVVGVDGPPIRPAGGWRRWVFRPESDAAADPARAALPSLYAQLGALGGTVRVIHRETGLALSAQELAA